MAVAGCINAYDCAGCYLTTLQQLQSDNIGVAINYTAPGEYGRRQLDYIKYTDKCGCTCCLTGENELKIVATQGVIKNFTLTNDDTNERVIVKWNDLFGSNRAYTMVRYKTGSYPTSISDGTLAVKETTQNQYSVSGYNVSGLTDGTTYYFTAFAVSQDGTIIVMQSKTIAVEFGIPAEYQELDYIQDTGSQYIVLGIQPTTNTQCETKIEVCTTVMDHTILGTYYNSNSISSHLYYHLTPFQNKWYFATYNSESNGGTYDPTIGKQYTIVFNNSRNMLNVDGTDIVSVSGAAGYSGSKLCIGARATSNARYGYFKYFYFNVYDKSQNKYIYKLVPCFRVSDGATGMFDKVSKTFFQSTGTFIKGHALKKGGIQEVEYIETTGTQFIDTEIYANSNTQVEVKVYETTSSNNNPIPVFGSYYQQSYNDGLGGYYHLTPFQNRRYFGKNGSEGNGGSHGTGTIYTIVFNNSSSNLVINNSTIGSCSGCQCYSGSTLSMSRRGSLSSSYYGKHRYYYFKMYDKSQSKYVRNLTPCYLKKTGVIGMYDSILDKVFINAGTGTFTKGEDVN